MASRRIGELLIEEGLLTDAALRRALSFQRLSGDRIRLGSILLHWDLLAEEALLATLSKLHRCPAVPWSSLERADVETVRVLPPSRAIQYGAIPYAVDRGALRVAFWNPDDLASVDGVAAVVGRRVLPGVTTEIRLLQAHRRFYGRHLPLEFRSIAAKLERKGTGARKQAAWELDFDFRKSRSEEPGEVREFPSRYGHPAARIPIHGEESPGAVDVSGAAVPGPLPSPVDETPPPAPTILPRRAPAENSLFTWVADALAAVDEVGHGEAWDDDSSPGRAESSSRVHDREAETAAGMWRSARERPGSSDGGAAEGRFLDSRAREEFVRAVLGAALPQFPRVILFGAQEHEIVAWGGRGRDLSSDRIAAIRIARRERSLFSLVEGWSPHFGAVKRDDWPSSLALVLGAAPPECAVFPIRFLERIVAYLYADRLGEQMRREDFAPVARAAAASADLFSRAARRGSVTRV